LCSFELHYRQRYLMKCFKLLCGFVVCFVLSAFTSWSQGFKVQGVVSNFSGRKLYLSRYEGMRTIKVDSTAITSNEAPFSFVIKSSPIGNIYLLQFDVSQQFYEFLIEDNATINITVDAKEPRANTIVSGTVEAMDFAQFIQKTTVVGKNADSLNKKLSTCKTATDSSAIQKQIEKVRAQVGDWQKNYVKKNSTGFLAALYRSMPDIELPASMPYVQGKQLTEKQIQYLATNFWKSFDYSQPSLAYSPLYAFKMRNLFMNLTNPRADTFK
jgi:hypothetical protein